MKRNLKPLILIGTALLAVQGLIAQNIPTIEMPRNATVLANSNYGAGASTTAVVTEFKNDAANSNVFSTFLPQSTLSVALANQQFTGLSYGTANYNGTGVSTLQTTGLVFGIGPSLVTDPTPQGGNPYNRYNIIGEYGGNGGPTNAMFTSNPTATGAQLGTGINVANASNASLNGAVEVFTTAQALYNNPAFPVGSRVYFGDLVLTFNQPVKNPVIHIAGLGGSYRYLPFGAANVPANYVSTFFSTELELQTPGLTSTFMSGNQFFSISGNNILNNNDVNPNGGSTNDPTEFINNFGAASGSVRVNGTVQQLVYRVYLQSGTGSQFAWSASGTLTQGPGAPRDPFTGDIWYVAASYDRPALQVISGNVFNDADGLVDNNISQTLTSVGPVANATTNAGGLLFANLLNSSGQVVASQAIAANGSYLFDNVPVGTYSVQLTTNSSAGTYAAPAPAPATVLPAGWVNTGEFNGIGAGNDGTVNGQSASITLVAGDIKSDNNFGIERLPESVDFTRVITTPLVGESIALTTPSAQRFGSLPILSGSDPEDMPGSNVLTGKAVKFTTLATVGASNTPATLRYNGVPITLNQTIPNFNPALLTVFLPAPWAGSGLRFTYAYVDAAGLADPTPATYRLNWSGGGTLIINLTQFELIKNNCSADLTWKTSSEQNSDRFEVEVRTGNNPVYTTAGAVIAAGTSTTAKTYQYSYPMQAGYTYYFRLKMINKDGSFTYSDTKYTDGCSKDRGTIIVGPIPTKDNFTIKGMEAGKNLIMLYADNGQLVKTQNSTITSATVDISTLAKGVYMLKITSVAGNTVVMKVVKN